MNERPEFIPYPREERLEEAVSTADKCTHDAPNASVPGGHNFVFVSDADDVWASRCEWCGLGYNTWLGLPSPIPMRIPCPSCGELHIDEGEFAVKSHHTHACQHCGLVWRPAIVPTIGVRFLPGFKNDKS